VQNFVNICNMFCLNPGLVLNARNVHLMICGMHDPGWMQNLQEKAPDWDENVHYLIYVYMICF
jgi:hypothetical protein